jgi:hypothetical protein
MFSHTSPVCTKIKRFCASLLRVVLLGVAAMSAGCSSAGRMADGPSWSLADKPPVALGGLNAEPKTALPDAPVYQYKGGRDPVTGLAGPAPVGGTGWLPTGAASHASAGRSGGEGSPRLVEVRKGDTLHGLSLTHHVSVKALMDANHLASSVIVPGKKLVIPQG